MKRILERLTSNRFLGVAVGAGITAVIQSSSATTVMVVGFVNSGMMTLRQAVWIIMGANIGTTVTGQLIALDVGALAPLFAFCGVVPVMLMKKAVFHHYGQIMVGQSTICRKGGNCRTHQRRPKYQLKNESNRFRHNLRSFLEGRQAMPFSIAT